jgi:hypothetical protein
MINLTHEMAEIKDQLTRSAAIRADARRREKEAEEETAWSQLRLNNLEIALRNVQCETERRLKRPRSHCECEADPAVETHMLPPPNPLETMGRNEAPAAETMSLLEMIREQIVSDVDADTTSMGLELEAEHWQRKEATAARCYTRAL